MDSGPTASSMRRVSLRKTLGVLAWEKAKSMRPPTTTPKVRPTSELMLVKSAKTSAMTPSDRAGTKSFMPILS